MKIKGIWEEIQNKRNMYNRISLQFHIDLSKKEPVGSLNLLNLWK